MLRINLQWLVGRPVAVFLCAVSVQIRPRRQMMIEYAGLIYTDLFKVSKLRMCVTYPYPLWLLASDFNICRPCLLTINTGTDHVDQWSSSSITHTSHFYSSRPVTFQLAITGREKEREIDDGGCRQEQGGAVEPRRRDGARHRRQQGHRVRYSLTYRS